MTGTIDQGMNHPAFLAADQVAPLPASRDADTLAWARHYAALALAAYTAFDDATRNLQPDTIPGSRPDLGYLTTIAVTATHAAAGLITREDYTPNLLWDLTPEAGALNGEYLGWLADTCDRLGVNPADLDPRYASGDFRSPMRVATTGEAR